MIGEALLAKAALLPTEEERQSRYREIVEESGVYGESVKWRVGLEARFLMKDDEMLGEK